jgi:hypothetical protein
VCNVNNVLYYALLFHLVQSEDGLIKVVFRYPISSTCCVGRIFLASQKCQGNSVQVLICTTQHGLLGYDTLLRVKRLYIHTD